MYITKVTDDYDNMTLYNCTNNENDIDIIIRLYYLQFHVVYHFYV